MSVQRIVDITTMTNEVDGTHRKPGLEFNANDIILLSELGRGNGGVVCKTQHKLSGFLMARKTFVMDIKTSVRAQIFRDLQILYECSSPFVVEYYGAFHIDDTISVYSEYMDAGGLDTLLPSVGRFPEPIIIQIAHAIVQGLLYLWEDLHIVHHNLKPSNVLVGRNGLVKLCDFVVSTPLVETLASAFVGMRTYMAPERLSGEPYNLSSDVWSLGLTLTELAVGHYPIPAVDPVDFVRAFAPDRESNMIEHWKAARFGEPLPALNEASNRLMGMFELFAYVVEHPAPRLPAYCFSADFIHLVHSCLQKEPGDRLSIELLGTEVLPQLFTSTMCGDFSASSDTGSADKHNPAVPVSIQDYLRGIFAHQQAEAVDAVALAVAEDFDAEPMTDMINHT